MYVCLACGYVYDPLAGTEQVHQGVEGNGKDLRRGKGARPGCQRI